MNTLAPLKVHLAGRYTAEEVSTVAAAIAAKPLENPDDLRALHPIADRSAREERARKLLRALQSWSTALRRGLRVRDRVTQHVLRAVTDGDYAELARLGIDTRYTWFDDIVSTMAGAAPLMEIETVRPYAAHHVTDSGEIRVSPGNLPGDEEAGLILAAVFRDLAQVCGNVRVVSYVDDADSYTPAGPLPPTQRDQYVLAIARLMQQQGVVYPDDIAGRDYVMVRKSENMPLIDELIQRLEYSHDGVVEATLDGDVVFRPTKTFVAKLSLRDEARLRELSRDGILLLRDGAPTTHALDAAGFLNPINEQIIHVVMLDHDFAGEQDRTYALLRALDIVTQERHHNVFFDSRRVHPSLIAYVVVELMADHARRYLRLCAMFDEWDSFDPQEYVTRNYGNQILTEDAGIISFVIEQLDKERLPRDGYAKAADVGVGPNLYPSMLIAPYVDPAGTIELLEVNPGTRIYLRRFLNTDDPDSPWPKFEDLMVDRGGEKYRGVFEKVRALGRVSAGSVFALPRDAYDIAASFFVSESITVSRTEFRVAIRELAASVKPDGILVVAHMVGSGGWHAGDETIFPAVRLGLEDIEQAYRDADLSFTTCSVGDDSPDKARLGYEGMTVIIARRLR